MPEWRSRKLGELVSIKHGFAFKGEYFTEVPQGPVLVTPGNFHIGGGFKKSKPKHYVGPMPAGFTLSPGDLVVSMTDLSKAADSLGFPAIIPDDAVYLHNQRIGLVCISRPDLLDEKFLYFALCSDGYHRHVVATATGSTVRHTSPNRICEYDIVLPSLSEQRAVAEVLDALDRKITENEKIRDTALLLGRSLLDKELQEGGVTVKVREAAELAYGKALPLPVRREGSVPVFGCTGQVGWHDTALTDKAYPVVGRKGANAGHVSWMSRPGWIIDTAFYARPARGDITSEALYFILDAAGIGSLIADSAVPGVNRNAALDHRMLVPNPGRMEKFARQAQSLLAVGEQTASENRTLADLRDTLLPQLLSGKLRVRDASRAVEEGVWP
ncbi:restriction endonuclease subunit S [Streptomyces sp. NPDC002131]|uniref:restriction endonuclease subunit S n=1 Tax=Streptomyces sp. NPDC002131 TaxID=3154535 RepID=UPI003323CB8D